jgi:riboflavin transporter FmnP
MTKTTMNSKTLAIIAVFSALSIILTLSPLKFAFPLLPFLKYQFWEVAIVIAFLLYGGKVGISISAINTLVLFAFFPGDLPSGPIYNFIAVLSMLAGISIVQRVAGTRFSRGRELILTTLSTGVGVVTRVVAMSIVNWIVLPLSNPFGYNIAPEALPELVALVAFFNATIVLYTIPLSYFIAKAVAAGTKAQIWSSSP